MTDQQLRVKSSFAESQEDRRTFRWRRVRLAFVASAASKLLGALLQIIVVPISVKALGVERFGIYTIIVSALAWIDLARLGVGPGLTQAMATAWNKGERGSETHLFSSAFFFVAGSCVLLALGIAVVLAGMQIYGVSLGGLMGIARASYQGEVYRAVQLVSVLLLLQILCSVAESARSAYQEDYVNSVAIGFGSLVAILVLLVAGKRLTSIPAFSLAMFGSVFLAKGFNFADLVLRGRTYLFPRVSAVKLHILKNVLRTSTAFWCAQIGALFITSLSILQVGAMIGPVALAPFAVLFRLLQLAATIALMFTTPLWPAIADACVRQDYEWIREAKRRLLLLVMSFALAISLIVGLYGEKIVAAWSGGSVQVSHVVCLALAGYFPIWMWNHCHLMVLYGFGRLRNAGLTVLAEGATALVLNYFFVKEMGAVGAAVGLCIAGAVVSLWILPLLVRNRLRAISGVPLN